MPTVLGTSFATSGFSYDPNLSPNNQSFSSAVLAVMARLGYPSGGGGGSGLPAGDFANPSVSVALTATNGTSSRAMRSDAAPALDQSIAPVWTGTHKFQGDVTVIGTSTPYAWGTGTKYPTVQFAGIGGLFGTATLGLVLTGGGVYFNGTNYVYGQAGTGLLLSLLAGTLAVQIAGTAGTAGGSPALLTVLDIAGTVTSNRIRGYGPTAAGLVDMTPDSGTYNGTATGLTSGTSVSAIVWARNGNQVTLVVGVVTGSSNATNFVIGQLPASIQPTRSQVCAIPASQFQDNSASINTAQALVSGAAITFRNNGNPNGFTAAGTKGVQSTFNVTYVLN